MTDSDKPDPVKAQQDLVTESSEVLGSQRLLPMDFDVLRAAELSEKHGVDAGALLEMVRAHPELRADDDPREHKLVGAETEARIVAHPEFSQLPRN
jgi:hypothetical protein